MGPSLASGTWAGDVGRECSPSMRAPGGAGGAQAPRWWLAHGRTTHRGSFAVAGNRWLWSPGVSGLQGQRGPTMSKRRNPETKDTVNTRPFPGRLHPVGLGLRGGTGPWAAGRRRPQRLLSGGRGSGCSRGSGPEQEAESDLAVRSALVSTPLCDGGACGCALTLRRSALRRRRVRMHPDATAASADAPGRSGRAH